MTNSGNLYTIGESEKRLEEANYFFTSQGHKAIIKVVQYTFVGINANRLTYNLGFGTLSHDDRTIQDHDISANGDQYKVFNTVLSTIPDFFEHYPNTIVVVAGSDSAENYPEICRPTCMKKCTPPDCRKANRRISIYKSFVNKNFAQLSKEYQFWGSRNLSDKQVIIEDYIPFASYNSVLFIRK